MTELLPCPFCGGTPILELFNDGFFDCARIRCCRVMFDWCGDETGEQAIAAWNRRATDTNVGTITRCADCESWDKSISFMGAHACAHWSPSRKEPRYTQWFDFCSFARSKPKEEHHEDD